MSTIGGSKAGQCDRVAAYVRMARGICVAAALSLPLVVAPAAVASLPFTWDGRSPKPEWSAKANWKGGEAPAAAQEIGALAFPELTKAACTAEPPTSACYSSFNNVRGLSAESVQIDDGNNYVVKGEEVTLGGGGLTAAPGSGSSGQALDLIEIPLKLTASQTWSVSGRGTGPIGENGLFLEDHVTGPSSSALTIELSGGPALDLGASNDIKVGPVKIDGTSASKTDEENGVVELLGGELNFLDEQPVELSHIVFGGHGELGRLTTANVELGVGAGSEPTGGIKATSVTLDSASKVAFKIAGAGATPGQDYSQLRSEVTTELGGAAIAVEVEPPSAGQPCPALLAGQTYTLIATTGTLSGSFANAPEHGAEIPIRAAKSCGTVAPKTMRIGYVRSGGLLTVTGTVEAEAKERQEAKEREARAPQEAKELQEAKEQKEAAKAREVRLAEEAAAAKRRSEEAAKAGVLGAKEGFPNATLASTSLAVSSSGAFVVKIQCPALETRCTGTITLRTLRAVRAGVAGRNAKQKAAVLTLAAGSFTVAGGQSRALTLHLSTSARKLLSSSHVLSARATIVAHDPGGATHTGQTVVTLRAPQAKHGKG